MLFVGLTGRTEWRWSKLHDRTWVDQTAGGELLVLAVDDRRRNSGVWVDSVFAAELRGVVDVAIAHHNGDRDGLVARLEAAAEEFQPMTDSAHSAAGSSAEGAAARLDLRSLNGADSLVGRHALDRACCPPQPAANFRPVMALVGTMADS